MSTREVLVSALHAAVNAAVLAAYPHLTTGCTRDLPEIEDILPKSKVPPESTPLAYLHEGDEHYASCENGVTQVELNIRLTAIVKRREGVSGPLTAHRNTLLALLQKTAWNWRPADGLGGAYVGSGGDCEVTIAPEEAWCHLPLILNFHMRDDDP